MDAIDIETLKELAQAQASDIGISEENVKQKFLVPLLEALGHQRRDLDFERSAYGKRYDVFIKGLKNDCKVIVDTKRYAEDLNQHLTQIGTYATLEGALITVITNGVEIRLYSPLRGIAFERSLLHSIRREDLNSERAITILRNFLSRTTLTSSEVHKHLDARERGLRNAYAKVEELNERYEVLRENLNAEIADLENRRDEIQDEINVKRKEASELEAKRVSEVAVVWEELGLKPSRERAPEPVRGVPAERPDSSTEPHERIDFETLILETLLEAGGRGSVPDILSRIENKLQDNGQLSPYWLALDPNQIRWQHAVHSARVRLVRQGMLSKNSERGVWELTAQGHRKAFRA